MGLVIFWCVLLIATVAAIYVVVGESDDEYRGWLIAFVGISMMIAVASGMALLYYVNG